MTLLERWSKINSEIKKLKEGYCPLKYNRLMETTNDILEDLYEESWTQDFPQEVTEIIRLIKQIQNKASNK